MARSILPTRCALLLAATLPFALVAVSPMRAAQADDTPDPVTIEPVRVRFDAPLGCSDGAHFVDEVMARTPRVRAAKGDEPARVFRVSIARRDGALRGTLVVEEPGHASKPRAVHGASCDDVLSALALIAALAIDPRASTRAGGGAIRTASTEVLAPLPAASAAESTDAAEPDAATTAAPALSAAPDASIASIAPSASNAASARPEARSQRAPDDDAGSPRWTFAAGAMFDVVGAAAPGAVPGGRVLVDVAREGAAFEPAIRLAAAHDGETSVGRDVGSVRLAWTTFDLDLCPWALRIAAISAKPCLAMELGVVSASASGLISNAQHRVRPWGSAGALALVEWRIAKALLLEAQGGARAPLTRETFVFQPDFPVYTTPRVMIVGGVGLGVRFR